MNGQWLYPHMCRDGHDEVGWRGDGEMCPVCRETAAWKGILDKRDEELMNLARLNRAGPR